MSRWIRRLVFVMLFGALTGAAAYFRSEGFSQSWRSFVMEQFEKRGVYLTLEKLTLDPLEGIVAQKIQVFRDKEHQAHLASVDRLDLDLDYTKLLRNEPFINGVDMRNASVSLPIDPKDAQSPRIEMSELSARVYIQGDHINILKAEGRLFGLYVTITGSLVQAPPTHDPEQERRDRELAEKRLAAIRARRGAIEEASKLLRHFESARKPMLTMEINGDLSHPEKISASLHLSAKGLRHGNYVCEVLDAEANYADESIDLSRLYLKDHLGELQATASYQIGAPSVDFHLHSEADIPALASAIFEEDFKRDFLRELVFYKDDPLEISADGQALLETPGDPDPFVPVRCTGRVHAGRFTSRGKVLDGLTVNFGLAPEGCYLRDLVLRHKTGTLALQAMWRRSEGFRYRAVLRMQPDVFLPFVPDPRFHEIVERFGFREDSSIYAQVDGSGPSPDFGECRHQGHAELHDFQYKGVEFASANADVEIYGPTHTYRQVKVQREEGRASADEVACNNDAHTVRLKHVVADCDLVAVVSCFDKNTADVIARYRFDKNPHAEMDGIFYPDGPGDASVHVKFRGEGTAHYFLWGEDYTVHKPVGELQFKGPQLRFDVSGGLFGTDMNCKGTTNLADGASDYGFNFKAGVFPYTVFGKPLPFTNLRTVVNCRKGILDFDVKSSLLDGSITLKGSLDDRKTLKPYQGELRYDALSFKKFSRVYSPGFDTEGDLTGHFEFTGRLDDWKALRGTGAVVILNSNLYAVPILGPLTPLLGGLLPRPMKGFNIAKEADATFTVQDGFADTKDVAALTGVFRIVASGRIDFIEDRIKFYAKAKVRGLPGIVLLPVSQILEYVGEGTVEDPGWRPRYFSASSDRTQMRRPDSSETEKIPRAMPVDPPPNSAPRSMR